MRELVARVAAWGPADRDAEKAVERRRFDEGHRLARIRVELWRGGGFVHSRLHARRSLTRRGGEGDFELASLPEGDRVGGRQQTGDGPRLAGAGAAPDDGEAMAERPGACSFLDLVGVLENVVEQVGETWRAGREAAFCSDASQEIVGHLFLETPVALEIKARAVEDQRQGHLAGALSDAADSRARLEKTPPAFWLGPGQRIDGSGRVVYDHRSGDVSYRDAYVPEDGCACSEGRPEEHFRRDSSAAFSR